MRPSVKQIALEAKGFLSEDEGLKLFDLAREAARRAPCLEVGTYCGKSSLFLAEGCRASGQHPLFCIDHHLGSVEQQPGEEYFDPDLYDAQEQVFTTLHAFMSNVRRAGLSDWTIPIVTNSARMSKYWPEQSLSLVFIDGGHSVEDVSQDYHGWNSKIIAGGYLCFHDIYQNPDDGGQAPYHMFEQARKTGLWGYVTQVGSLGILRRR
jgi:predicted O-methyltransferase YrrM